MTDFHGVLEDVLTGQRVSFTDRSDYLATLYGGGMREVEAPPSPPARELPDPRTSPPSRRQEPISE